MTELQARRAIGMFNPNSKFGGYSYIDEFLDLEARIGKGFYYVNLYDENIKASLIDAPQGVILVTNAYVSSTAYNIILAWLFEFRRNNGAVSEASPLVKYNVKKFFGEQLIHQYNNVFSRAIFLETLLYEEQQMRPVFALMDADPAWKATAQSIAEVMGNLIMFHETGHYYFKYLPEMCNELVEHYGEVAKEFVDSVRREFNPGFSEEVFCDVFAILFRMIDDENDEAAITFTLRSAVMGYSIFALLWSLEKSVQKTADKQSKEPDVITLISFERSTQEYSYEPAAAEEMIERARLVTVLCEQLASVHGVNLYGQDGLLPLRQGTLLYFLNYVNHVIETDQPEQRGMARLVAESLHGHLDGLQYLYLHSKVFNSPRPLTL